MRNCLIGSQKSSSFWATAVGTDTVLAVSMSRLISCAARNDCTDIKIPWAIHHVNDSPKNDVTTLLLNAESGVAISDELLPLVYDELRNLAAAHMAKELPGQTLQPTALVHEAYMRLVGNTEVQWDSRGHFFGAAARSMRQILINRANKKKTEKHGGKLIRRDLDDAFLADEPPPERLLALDAALIKLEKIDARKGQIVMLRYFAGLSIEETAKSLETSVATVKRDWQFARTWLHREMSTSEV